MCISLSALGNMGRWDQFSLAGCANFEESKNAIWDYPDEAPEMNACVYNNVSGSLQRTCFCNYNFCNKKYL